MCHSICQRVSLTKPIKSHTENISDFGGHKFCWSPYWSCKCLWISPRCPINIDSVGSWRDCNTLYTEYNESYSDWSKSSILVPPMERDFCQFYEFDDNWFEPRRFWSISFIYVPCCYCHSRLCLSIRTFVLSFKVTHFLKLKIC